MKYLYLIISFLIISCKTNTEINKITYKFSGIEYKGNLCNECEPNNKECCEIYYLSRKFYKNYHYKFRENGQIDSIYSYHVPLGVTEFSLEEYVKAWDSRDSLLSFNVLWDKNNSEIIENGKKIKNFKIDVKNKFIYIFKKKKEENFKYKQIDIYVFE